MSRIKKRFAELAQTDSGALIAYLTAGHPTLELTPKLVDTLVSAGADIIELGIPFSDPIADGPIIQSAVQQALESGTTPQAVIRTAQLIKEKLDVPVAVLSYYNPIYRMGTDKFTRLAARSGIDGLIVPDLPYEEAGELRERAKQNGVDTILLASPSTSKSRLQGIIENCSGFLYLVSLYGTTGERSRLRIETTDLIRRVVTETGDRLPVAAGFGISRPDHVRRALMSGAKGAVVGSTLVRIVSENASSVRRLRRKLAGYTSRLKKATFSAVS